MGKLQTRAKGGQKGVVSYPSCGGVGQAHIWWPRSASSSLLPCLSLTLHVQQIYMPGSWLPHGEEL